MPRRIFLGGGVDGSGRSRSRSWCRCWRWRCRRPGHPADASASTLCNKLALLDESSMGVFIHAAALDLQLEVLKSLLYDI